MASLPPVGVKTRKTVPTPFPINTRAGRTPLTLKGMPLILLSFQTLGIIYSDIGTSPLYTLNGIWPSSAPAPSKEDIIGGISAIIWALTLLPLLKYVFISLRFGTHEGEGGTFALFQGLFPPAETFDDDRVLTGDSFLSPSAMQSLRNRISKRLRWPLLVWCLLGTSLTMADGLFTPAVSVTSAVGGIAVAKPSIASDIKPISIALLVAFFLLQRFGTTKISFLFAPVSFVWFLLLASGGIYNVTTYPGILRAFDPSRAIMLFVRTGDYDLLAGVLLALTGCEAMFASLGQFNALSIQISFTGFVYPAIVLAYLGQGARLIVDGDSVITNVFYQSIPGPANGAFFWINYVAAILATIIASQTMITATFSLIQQVVNLKSLPPLRMVYTSETIQGQVYVPAANWALMIGTIVIVAAFKNLTAMTNAYGFAVATVMFSTSILLAIQMRYVKHWPIVVGLLYLLVFGFFDGLFWGAALKKVPHGAWVPLAIGIVLSIIMLFWTWAKGLEDKFDGANRMNLRHVIYAGNKKESSIHGTDGSQDNVDTDTEDDGQSAYSYYLSPSVENSEKSSLSENPPALPRIPACAIFHKFVRAKGVPHSFIGFIRQWPALPRVVIFLSVSVISVARVPPESRYVVSKVRSIDGFYGVTYNIGYRDNFEIKADELVNEICALEVQLDPRQSAEMINDIKQFAATVTHIVPHYHVKSKKLDAGAFSTIVNSVRTYFLEGIYHPLATMFPETSNWLTSADEIIHVGVSAAI